MPPATVSKNHHPAETFQSCECVSIDKNQTSVPLAAPYHLRALNGDSTVFFQTLHRAGDEVLMKLQEMAETIVDQYEFFVTEDKKEVRRSFGEYAIEFLTIGIMLQRYGTAAMHTSVPITSLLRALFSLRRSSPGLKPLIDRLRGFLGGVFIIPNLERFADASVATPSREVFSRLVDWLAATGEFKDEVKRFVNWRSFFSTITAGEAGEHLATAARAAQWFERFGSDTISRFTAGLDTFHRQMKHSYRGREDALFCGKSSIEYHVNMVASEIMNRGLRDIFTTTASKVVLVPGCMRPDSGDGCRATITGTDITCSHCTNLCNINRLSQLGETRGFSVRIIPHSSGFTRWLRKYARQSETGVVAIACTLNIVAGGYEMRELEIPSQCVMLDYCGCRKHWDAKGIPTDVNDRQVQDIL